YSWCLSNNLEELEKDGFTFKPRLRQSNDFSKSIQIDHEISHGNSIYEIPDNALSDKIPAFRKGNFIVNLFIPSFALLILDSEMKHILWYKNLGQLKNSEGQLTVYTHDNQVLPDGNILSYANQIFIVNSPTHRGIDWQNWNSNIIKWNPLTNEVTYLYSPAEKSQFKAAILGTATELSDGAVLFTNITERNLVLISNNKSELVWSFNVPAPPLEVGKFSVRKAKPFINESFINVRGLK
ncbi:MAG: hypothetical protein ACXWQQ_14085, partial [Pseudobdellovibrio sp.]